MADSNGSMAGRVVSIWRYPVKSMLGEELDAVEIGERGLIGDRAFALIDQETGKVVSAKNPRRWPTLFAFRAAYSDDSQSAPSTQARITLPDSESVATDQADIDQRLSAAVGRPVHLARSGVEGAIAEGYWPDHEWLPQRDEVFEFPLPPGTFFDDATVHLITTATLDALRAAAPDSQFDIRRFRPNFLIEPDDSSKAFIEDTWIGRTLRVGDVQLRIDRPCPRCVMTTLSQGALPKDPAVLRAVVRENQGNAGVYATVLRGGLVRVGQTTSE